MSSSDLCLKEGAKSYVKLNYRKLTFKTKSLKGSSPVWSQVFFLGPFETTESLEISCWDKGSKWKKELLGRGTLSFTNFTKEGTYQHIIQLDGGKRNEVNGNTINGTIICGIKVEKNPLKRKSAVLGRRELDYWLQRRPEAEELVQKNLLKPVDLTHSPASGLIFAQSLENVMEHQKKHYPDLKTPALVENAISFITSHCKNKKSNFFKLIS